MIAHEDQVKRLFVLIMKSLLLYIYMYKSVSIAIVYIRKLHEGALILSHGAWSRSYLGLKKIGSSNPMMIFIIISYLFNCTF